MTKTIEELAFDYIQSIVGTDPNTDISLFENEYNAFIAGANAVKNNVGLADVSDQRELLLAFAEHLFEGHDKEVEVRIVDDYLNSK